MKTNKKCAGEKDWRKADARVLGQILAAQNIEFALPDITHIAEFYAETLLTIPGITACRVCLEDVSIQRGEMQLGICAECQASRKRDANQDEWFSHELDFKCGLVKQPGIQFAVVASLHHHFGSFVFLIDDAEPFNTYKPFIDNLANYVAISLENRLQESLLQKAHDELERRVEERTDELRASNETIKDLYNNAPCGYHSLDRDGFFVLINDTELCWLGHSREEIIGRVKFRDLLTANSLKTFEANFPGFKERGRVSDLEFEMVRKDGTILPVLLNATAVTDGNGNYVMSRSTIFDITERKQAEDALQERERHSQSLLRLSRNLESAQTYTEVLNAAQDEVRNIIGYQNLWVYLLTEDKKYFRALVADGPISDTVMSEAGTATLTIQGDRMLEEIAAAKEIVVVEDAHVDKRTNKEIVAQLGNRTIVNVPIILFDRHLGSVGTGTFGEEGVRPPTESEKKYLAALASQMAVALDRIHLLIEQKHAEKALHRLNRELRAISDCNQILLRAVDEQTLLNDICRIVCDEAGYRMAWVGYAEYNDAKSVRPVAWAGLEDGYLASADITWADTERGHGPSGTTIRTGESAYIRDFITDPQAAPWRENALQHGYRSSIALPLKDETASTFGSLCIYSTEPNAFTAGEVRLLEELAGDLAFGIVVLRARTERKRAEESLRQSEELLRVTLTNILDPVFITDNDGNFTFICPNVLDTLGYSVEEIQALGNISRLLGDGLFNPEELEMHGEIISIERLMVDNFGRQRVFLATVKRVSIGKGTCLYALHDITRRKQAEDALRESETKFRAIFESSVDAIGVSKAGIHTFVNPAYLTLFGYADNAELNGKPILDLISPSHRAQVLENIRLRASGQPAPAVYETRGLRKDGSEFDMDVHMSTYELNGEIYSVPILRDITERKQAEENLRQMNERFSLATRAAHLGVWDWDIQKDELVWDDGMYELYGVKREDFAGAYEAWLKGIHPDDRIPSDEISKQAGRGEREYDTEFRVVWPDGSLHYLKAYGQFVRDADGKPLRMTGVNFDITTRKQAEQELQVTNDLLRAIIEAAPTAIIGLNLEGKVQAVWNPAAEKMLGWSAQEAMGNFLPTVSVEKEAEFRQFREWIRSGKTMNGIEVHRQKRDGTPIDYSIYASPLHNPDGQVTGNVAVLVDITERKQMEAALWESSQMLKLVLENMPAYVFWKDCASIYLGCNYLFAANAGLNSPEEIIGLTDLDLPWKHTEAGNYRADDQLVMETGIPKLNYEETQLTADGQVMAVRTSKIPLRNSQGAIIGVLGTFEDITERKRAEEALRKSEVRYRALFAHAPDAIFLENENDEILDVNPAACALLGYSRAELLAMKVSDLQAPEIQRQLENVIKNELSGHGNTPFEGVNLRRDGSRVAVEISDSRMEDSGLVLSIVRDITERKRTENIRQARLRLLEFAGSHSLDELLIATLDEIEALTGSVIGFYHFVEADQKTLRLQNWSTNTLKNMCTAEGKGSHYAIDQAGIWVDCVHERHPVIHNDYASLPHRKGLPEGHAPVVRELVVPIFRGNLFKAIIGVGNKTADYNESDIEITSQLADLSWDIAERKRAEDALHQSEERFRRLAENARDVIYRMSIPDGKYEYVSSAVLSVFGYSPEECYQTPILIKQAIHPNWQIYFEEQWANLIKGEMPPTYEYQFIHRSGEVRWLNQRNIMVHDHAGNPIAIEGIVTDITERKQAEEALRRSEAGLKEAQHLGCLGSWDWDTTTNKITWSEEYSLIYGFDPTQPPPSYEEHLKAYTPESAAQLDAAVKKNIETGEAYVLDLELIRSDGPNRWITARSETKRNQNGQIVGLRGTAQDITERKRAEIAVLRRSRQLEILSRASQQINIVLEIPVVLRQLVAAALELIGASDGTAGLMLDGKMVFKEYNLNGQLTPIDYSFVKGYGVPGWVMKTRAPYTSSDAEHDPHVIPEIQKALGFRNLADVPIFNRQGELLGCFEIHNKPSGFDDTDVLMLQGLAASAAIALENTAMLTERKLAEEKIHKLNQELEQRVLERTAELEVANKELEAFAYSVSHDLRAPLRHIDGFLELLKERTATIPDAKSQHYMATISDAAKRMGVLIDDLLSFSRMGRNEMSKSQVDLGELVQDVIREFRPETEGREVQWKISPLPLVTGDRAMLRIVLVNLISNALKFTQSRSPAEIEIGWMSGHETETIIFVRDNGVGFDLQYADKLFGVFQRLHRADEFEGTGIGLANVRRIINRHGGRTWAEAEIDHGATFYFSLPQFNERGT